jgi:hypothetical protein
MLGSLHMVKPEFLPCRIDLSGFRATLLASAALTALFLAAAPPAEARPDRCTYNSPTEVTCSGDLFCYNTDVTQLIYLLLCRTLIFTPTIHAN